MQLGATKVAEHAPEWKNPFAVHPLNWFIAIVIFWGAILHFSQIEGQWFPAAKPLTIIGKFPTTAKTPQDFTWGQIHGGPYTAIWIQSTRLRPNCGPRRLEWFLGKRPPSGRPGSPVVANWGPAVNHPDGVFFSGPWVIQIEIQRLSNTYADVIHRCVTAGISREVRTPIWN